MSLTRVVDHVEQGLALLLEQYKNKPRLEGWLSAYLRQVQLLEDAIYDVLIKRMIDVAVGAQLDALGRIVGERRNDRTDDNYRLFIRVRVRINRSLGTNVDILAVLAMITVTPYIYDEYYPAALLLEFTEITDLAPVEICTLVRDTKTGGVGLNMIVPTTDLAHRFLWKSVGDPDVAANGYGNASAPSLTDGLLSDAVTIR